MIRPGLNFIRPGIPFTIIQFEMGARMKVMALQKLFEEKARMLRLARTESN